MWDVAATLENGPEVPLKVEELLYDPAILLPGMDTREIKCPH